jgi:hypothetical protein
MIKSFAEYVDEHTLIELIIKERVKSAAKKTVEKKEKQRKGRKKQDKKEKEQKDICQELHNLTPPRNTWRRLRKKTRNGISSTAVLNKLALRNTIRYDIEQVREHGAEAPSYLVNLLQFIEKIKAIVNSDKPIDFSGQIKVIAQFKKNDGDTAIYRPLSVYNSLETKVLISLASEYLTKYLDSYLHPEILAYRPKRVYHDLYRTTSGEDAIYGIRDFIDDHYNQPIYVAECDIQKFYDVINHDVVVRCFQEIAHEAQIPRFHEVERIIKAYLDSYSFHKDIMSLNDCQEYWEPYRQRQGKQARPFCRFEWVSDECLKGCYGNDEELAACKALLGVPQGGALSCVIANVVLNSVDKVITKEQDTERFFVRYGDDILLAHTDYDKCKELIEAYTRSLEEHRLPYHPFKPLSECKDGEKTTKEFWDRKSKAPFFWGPGEGNAFEWIGFVGYEVRYTGETRLRLSTLNKKFGAINKRYHACILDKTPNDFKGYMKGNRKKLRGLPSSMSKFPALDKNMYTIQQMKSLDRYRLTKILRLQDKLESRFGAIAQKDDVPIDIEKTFITQWYRGEAFSFYRQLK